MSKEKDEAAKALQHAVDVRTATGLHGRQFKPKPSSRSSEPYVVWIENTTAQTLTVEIIYAVAGVGQAQDVTIVMSPGQIAPFVLVPAGSCQLLVAYYVCINGGDLWPDPETGPMTPQRASQVNPADTNQCADYWGIG